MAGSKQSSREYRALLSQSVEVGSGRVIEISTLGQSIHPVSIESPTMESQLEVSPKRSSTGRRNMVPDLQHEKRFVRVEKDKLVDLPSDSKNVPSRINHKTGENQMHRRNDSSCVIDKFLKSRPSESELEKKNIIRRTSIENRSSNLEQILKARPGVDVLLERNIISEEHAHSYADDSPLTRFLGHRSSKNDIMELSAATQVPKSGTVMPTNASKPEKHRRGLSRFMGQPAKLRNHDSEETTNEMDVVEESSPYHFVQSQSVSTASARDPPRTMHERRQSLAALLMDRPKLENVVKMGIIATDDVPVQIKPDVNAYDDDLADDDLTTVIFMWGQGLHGQLGIDNTRSQQSPQLLKGLLNHSIKQVSVGGNHTLALTEEGTCFAWGSNSHGQLGIGEGDQRKSPTSLHLSRSPICQRRVKFITAAGYHSGLIDDTDIAYSFGKSENGVLGLGSVEGNVTMPVEIKGLSSVKVEKLSFGTLHSAAISVGGDLYMWGRGDEGQLGQGMRRSSNLPVLLEEFPQFWETVKCGETHTIAIGYNKSVYSWGSNSFGQLGLGHTQNIDKPTIINALRHKGIVQVDAGLVHSIALSENGNLYSTNVVKRDSEDSDVTFSRVPPSLAFIRCAASTNGIVAASQHGILYSWEFVDNDAEASRFSMLGPDRISNLQGLRLVDIVADSKHFALLSRVPVSDTVVVARECGLYELNDEEVFASRGSDRVRMRNQGHRNSLRTHKRNASLIGIDASLRSVAQQ